VERSSIVSKNLPLAAYFTRGVTLAVLAGAIIVIFAWWSVTTVPSGSVGIVTTFGKVDSQPLPEGLHLVAPWRSVYPLSVRTQEVKEVMEVPTKEGLTINLEVSLLFALDSARASEVFQKVGPNYLQVVVEPQFRSATRGVTVNYEAKDLYTAKRAVVERELETATSLLLQERGLTCDKVLLRKIELPPAVKGAIDQKMAAEQESQAMEFKLQIERQKADQKKIEAEGTAQAQRIITETLNENYIRYLWVKALETAAQNRATVIYVPTGKDGLPMLAPITPPAVTQAKDSASKGGPPEQ
jgi:regulator of protease activity HflC (stomatin/prohibitin superfamily)